MGTRCFCFIDGSHEVLGVMLVITRPLAFTESELGTKGSTGPRGADYLPHDSG